MLDSFKTLFTKDYSSHSHKKTKARTQKQYLGF